MDTAIQMLGTGSAFSKKYDNTNALITAGGFTLLVDCGSTAPRVLHQLQIPCNQLDGIFISHLHADHVGGLEEVAFRCKYEYRTKIKLYIPESLRRPLWEQTLRGGLENVREGITSLESYFEVVELKEGARHELHPGFRLEIIPTLHIPGKPCYGLWLNESIFYSGDTQFDPELIIHMADDRKARHILHECQLSAPGIVHTALSELLTLPERIQELISLMHYGDEKDLYVGKTGRMSFLEPQRIYPFT